MFIKKADPGYTPFFYDSDNEIGCHVDSTPIRPAWNYWRMLCSS